MSVTRHATVDLETGWTVSLHVVAHPPVQRRRQLDSPADPWDVRRASVRIQAGAHEWTIAVPDDVLAGLVGAHWDALVEQLEHAVADDDEPWRWGAR